MASKKPLALYNGVVSQLQAGDTLDASVNEIDVIAKTIDTVGGGSAGQAFYVKNNANVDLARANAGGTTYVLGLLRANTAQGASGSIQTDGVLSLGDWTVPAGSATLTVGGKYFLSATTAGQLTTTAPTDNPNFVVFVGTAISTTELEISINNPIQL